MALTLAVLAGTNAKAGLINVQFGCTAGAACAGANASSAQQTGAAVIGSPGDTWNLVSGSGGIGTTGSNVPLVDSTGTSTPVTVSWTSSLDWVVIPGQESGFGSTPDADLMSAYLVSLSSDVITISGLDAMANYTLYMITQVPVFGDGRRASLSVNGGPAVVSAPAVASTGTFIEGQNYLVFNAQADGLGNITVNYSAFTGEADINGFQLSGPTAPEPGTLGMVGVVAALIGYRRRRGRKPAPRPEADNADCFQC